MSEMRVCQLGETAIWRVERLSQPRWFAFWLKPRWQVVYRPTLWFDYIPAEYDSHLAAITAMEKFQKWDAEHEARQRGDWRCGAKA